jgi:hypothetical protein
MFKPTDIQQQLAKCREKNRDTGENLVLEARRILQKDLFAEENILANLKQYNQAVELLDEESLDEERIFSLADVKKVCVNNRLKFLESKAYKPEIPYEAVLRIRSLNSRFAKNIREFKILATPKAFVKSGVQQDTMLFAKTNYDNYYLVHQWGRSLPWYRRLQYWPMQNFENLFLTVIALTLILALSLPTWLITLDHKAEYWSGYRAAAFFHLLIFNMGVTAYITFAFNKNFSSSVWNREQEFD